jgi:sulfur-oxidizing protein SoxX
MGRGMPLRWRGRRAVVCVLALAGCAALAPTPTPDYDALMAQMLATSFRGQGIAGIDRLRQDAANAACSQAQGAPLPAALRASMQQEALNGVRWPDDGQFIGDWREGEKLAQSGRGMTWTDRSPAPSANGGGCYNCHQLTPQEIAYGTLGPSLVRYGRLRGVSDLRSAPSQPVLRATWTQLWNAKTSNACSGMPRFGAAGLLDQTQLKHLMALLLDPESPVNR